MSSQQNGSVCNGGLPRLDLDTALVNPRCACAARVTVLGLSVCLSVCLSVRRLANLAVQGTGRPMTATTAFERYGVKTS